MTTDLLFRIRSRAIDPATRTDVAGSLSGELRAPASVEQVTETERRLGCRLPPLLAAAYATVGNGGWGPGYGLLGIVGGIEGKAGDGTGVDLYEVFRGDDPEDPGWKWPPGLLPINDWGCAIRTCVDCTTPDGAVWTFDPNSTRALGDSIDLCLAKTHDSIAEWFEDWVNGVKLWDLMFEIDEEGSRMGINPFTKESMKFEKTRLRRR